MKRGACGTIALALFLVASTPGHAARPASGTTEMEGISIGARTSGQGQPGYLLDLQIIDTEEFKISRVKEIVAPGALYVIGEAIFLAASYSFTGYSVNGEFLPYLITIPFFDTQDFSLYLDEKTRLTPQLRNIYSSTAESVFVANYGYLFRPFNWKRFALSAAAGRRFRQIEVDTGTQVKGKDPSYDQRTVYKTWVGLVGFRTMPVNHVHLSFDYVAVATPIERRTTLTDPSALSYVRHLDPFPTRWLATVTFDWY